jgi:hypothetical protein
MSAARLILKPYYALRPRLWREPLRMVNTRSFVSHRGRYLYIRIPKAANTTVVAALLAHCPEPGLDAARLGEAKDRATHLGDLGMGDLRRLRGYFVFTVVRDPYARTLSAYLDKFKPGKRYVDLYGARVAAFDGGTISFRGFCRYLAAGGEPENAHWIRQTRLTGLADRIDLVGRTETLDTDLARILAAIGVGAAPGPVERAGPVPTHAGDRLGEYYDAETREIVEHVYADDFAAFGYPRRPG